MTDEVSEWTGTKRLFSARPRVLVIKFILLIFNHKPAFNGITCHSFYYFALINFVSNTIIPENG